jgi:kynurenine 3-monooxygenase
LAKHFLIGLGGRGITALEYCGVWEDVAAFCTRVPGRKEWTPETDEDGVERILTERKYTTQVLPRDKLVSVLHQHIIDQQNNQTNYDNPCIRLHYGYDVRPVSLEGDRVLVEIAKLGDITEWKPLTASLVIAADGSARSFANRMQEDDAKGVSSPFSVVRFQDDNPRVYKSIPFLIPSDSWRRDLNYAVRSKGSRVTFDALPANDRGDYLGILLLSKDDEMARENVDPLVFREFLDEVIPQFSHMLNDETVANTAQSPASALPTFRYVTPRLHQGKRTVLLGDCAHTVKPYFGMGANTALEDVKVSCDNLVATNTQW